MLKLDNGSNNARDLSSGEGFNDSSDDFSVNELSTSNTKAQHMAPEEVIKQGHMFDKKFF